jgi:hypothetical protein
MGVPGMWVKPESGDGARRGGGGSKWNGLVWWNCGSKSHAGVCAGFSTVDTGVSCHYFIKVAPVFAEQHLLPRRIRVSESEKIPARPKVSTAQIAPPARGTLSRFLAPFRLGKAFSD